MTSANLIRVAGLVWYLFGVRLQPSTRSAPGSEGGSNPALRQRYCTFRDFLILERSKTSGKRDPLGNNDYY
jgi:hypothetical protein